MTSDGTPEELAKRALMFSLISAILMGEGNRVRFEDDQPWWWAVRAASERFVVLTRQQPFRAKGTFLYTVIDWDSGVRGPCNRIGQGWGDGTFSDSECAELLHAMELGDSDLMGVEVSHRNRVSVRIEAVR